MFISQAKKGGGEMGREKAWFPTGHYKSLFPTSHYIWLILEFSSKFLFSSPPYPPKCPPTQGFNISRNSVSLYLQTIVSKEAGNNIKISRGSGERSLGIQKK